MSTFSIPANLINYLKFIGNDVLLINSAPSEIVEDYIKFVKIYKNNYEEEVIKRIRDFDTREKNLLRPKGYRIPSFDVPDFLKDYICPSYDKIKYKNSNIPSELIPYINVLKRKIEKDKLIKLENKLKEKIRIERFRNKKNEKFSDDFYRHIRYEQYTSNKDDGKIVFTKDIYKDELFLFEKYEKFYNEEKNFKKIMDTTNWFNLPPEKLFGYIEYNKYDISPSVDIPSDLVPVFNEYKTYIEETKNKYLKEINNI